MANKKLDRLKKLDYAGVSVGLASDIDHALELIRDAAEILEAVSEKLDDYADVRDGDNGEQMPNWAMQFQGQIESLLKTIDTGRPY